MKDFNDPALSYDWQYTRIKNDYNVHGKLIVAFDFDNTIYDFHKVGYKFPKVVELLLKCQDLGFDLILFSSCKDIDFMIKYCGTIGLTNMYINSSPVDSCSSPEKPYFNILLDDRAGLPFTYTLLSNLIEEVTNG